MRKLLVLAIALMVISAPAFAVNVITNGDFSNGTTGWSVWNQKGTQSFTVDNGQGWTKGSKVNGGIYQQFDVIAGQTYTVSGLCQADPYAANYMWAEVIIINSAALPVNGTDLNANNGGSTGSAGLWGVAKEDSWAKGSAWNETFAQMSKWNHSYVTFTAASNKATIVLKNGNGQSNNTVTGMRWDNVVVDGPAVPEPGSIVALMSGLVGFGGMIIRRKR